MPLEFRHEVLRAARLELGLTQEDTARALGIDVRTYRRYEAGTVNDPVKGFAVRRAGRRQLLGRIGQELGIAAEDLVAERATEAPGTEAMAAESPAAEAMAAEPPARPPPRPRIHHAHVLQPARHFVGREDALASLRQWSDPGTPGPRICALVAPGGTGKSALTQRWLEGLPEDPARGLLVWSFYEDRRTEAFLAAALRALGGHEPPHAPLETLEQLLDRVEGEAPHLLVLDGFEVIQADGSTRPRGAIEDPHLRRLLTTIAARPGGTRVLITSRMPLVDLRAWADQGLHTLRLGPLELAAQLELLNRWGVRATEAQARLALQRYGGHALSVATLASYVAGFWGGAPEALGSIDLGEAAQDDPLAFRLARLLDAYAAAMTESQRDLVARICAFPRGADVDTLRSLAREGGAIAGCMPTERRALVRALGRLEAMGVVFRSRETSSVFSAHPLVLQAFRERLGPIAAAIHDTQRQRLQDRLARSGSSLPRDTALEQLEDLVVHTVLAGRAKQAVSLYARAIGGFGHLGLERGDMARGLRILRTFFVDGDPERLREGLEPRASAWLLYELALYASAMGDPEFAGLCLRRYVSLTADAPRHHTTGLRTTAYVLRLQGQLDPALQAVDRALEVGRDHPDHVARNLGMRGAILHDQGDRAQAAECFARANAIDPGPRYRRLLWEAEHLLDQGRTAEAAALARQGREACLHLGWGGHISHCDVVLGHCEAEHDPQAATARLREARQWAYRSGEVEARLRCYELDVRLQRDPDARRQTRAQALALVRASGFERFAARLR